MSNDQVNCGTCSVFIFLAADNDAVNWTGYGTIIWINERKTMDWNGRENGSMDRKKNEN